MDGRRGMRDGVRWNDGGGERRSEGRRQERGGRKEKRDLGRESLEEVNE